MTPASLTSRPRPNPDAPWTVEEAIGRLQFVLSECRNEYQFRPNADDDAALAFLEKTAIEAAGAVMIVQSLRIALAYAEATVAALQAIVEPRR